MATAPEIPCAATIGFDDAQALLRAACTPLGVEWIPLAKAGRRVLARPVVAQVDSPRRNSAAMDGYAVRTQDLTGDIVRLRLTGESAAGGREPHALGPGTAMRISTGAPMPPGADRVVMREYARLDGEQVILRAPRGEEGLGKPHVRLRASDFARGTTLLAPGTRIDARAMVVAAGADLERLPVWRSPRLRVLANGDELRAPGMAALDAHGIPDSLSEALLLMGRQWGARPLGAARCPDRLEDLRALARSGLADADVIVIAGGASHGHRDLVREALTPLGLRVAFAGVAMKPGKPLWYGTIGSTHVIGLPGNPTAALTTARLFLAPLLAGLSGAGLDHALRWEERAAADSAPEGGDRDQFLCAYVPQAERGGDGQVCIIERQQASAQLMLAQADLLVERRAGAPQVAVGDTLRCLRF